MTLRQVTACLPQNRSLCDPPDRSAGCATQGRRLAACATRGGAEPDATYDYCDEDMRLLFQVCRFPDKQFRQRQPGGDDGWIWHLEGVRRVLYRLPELPSVCLNVIPVCRVTSRSRIWPPARAAETAHTHASPTATRRHKHAQTSGPCTAMSHLFSRSRLYAFWITSLRGSSAAARFSAARAPERSPLRPHARLRIQ